MSEPTATQITAGIATLYVAPVGTTAPTVTGVPATYPPTFGAAWRAVGYTDKGVDAVYTPTIKPYTPDEEADAVYDILDAEKFEISATLAEATVANYAAAISTASFSNDPTSKVWKVGVGGLTLTYTALAFLAPAPPGPAGALVTGRLVYIPKAIVMSAISVNVTRKDIQKFAIKWEARKIAGVDLYDTYDFYTGTGS